MIVYVFRTDVFWLPTGDSRDIYIQFWDLWYGNLVLTGQADRDFTNLVFYPEGVSLVTQPIFYLLSVVVNSLMTVLPLSNAYSVALLLMIMANAVCGYMYLHYVFKDKWLALFGAMVFGFAPQALSHYNHPGFLFVAPLPLCLYFVHRGINERRLSFMMAPGLLAVPTSFQNLYLHVCIVAILGFLILSLAVARWRDKRFWRLVAALVLGIGLASVLRLYPLISSPQSLAEAVEWGSQSERRTDLISFLVNFRNPITKPLIDQAAGALDARAVSAAAYLGIAPMILICIGLFNTKARRRMLPWLGLLALFLVLSLGSILVINGAQYPQIRLPKHTLNRLMPTVFSSFYEADHFITGLILPLSVTATYGLRALQESAPAMSRPLAVLALVGIVAIDYYVPVEENVIPQEQFRFLDWLAEEEDPVLIHVPMGRQDAKRYNLYQALSGYPMVEGAISRPPDAAFDYIYDNRILGEWRDDRPAICRFDNTDEYLAALDRLIGDGFTHVVYHLRQRDTQAVVGSFSGATPAYQDDYARIYRIVDLKVNCPRSFIPKLMSEAHAAEVLLLPSPIHERHGAVIGFQRDLPADERQLRLLSQAMFDHKHLVSVNQDEAGAITLRASQDAYRDLRAIESVNNGLWLVNNPAETDLDALDIFVNWFQAKYSFCRRYRDGANGTVDLYLKPEIPCEVAIANDGKEIAYDSGVRLLNYEVALDAEQLTFYSAWAAPLGTKFSYSLQLFDAQGTKVIQADDTIVRQPATMRQMELELPGGTELALMLIVYDRQSGKSDGGTALRAQVRFEREYLLATFEI